MGRSHKTTGDGLYGSAALGERCGYGVQAMVESAALAKVDVQHAGAGEARWRWLRQERLAAQQQREMQALLSRCTCQRDDLEKQLLRTLERHDKRCTAVVAVRALFSYPSSFPVAILLTAMSKLAEAVQLGGSVNGEIRMQSACSLQLLRARDACVNVLGVRVLRRTGIHSRHCAAAVVLFTSLACAAFLLVHVWLWRGEMGGCTCGVCG